jgi:hypothetical protein
MHDQILPRFRSFAVLSWIVAFVLSPSALPSMEFRLKHASQTCWAAESFTSPYLRIVEHIVDLSRTRATAVRCFATPDIGHLSPLKMESSRLQLYTPSYISCYFSFAVDATLIWARASPGYLPGIRICRSVLKEKEIQWLLTIVVV